MADKKISALDAVTTPLAGTEVLPVVQSGATKKVEVSNLTAGRAVSVGSLASSGAISGTTGAFSGNVTLTNSEVILSNSYYLKGKLVAGTNVNLIGRNTSNEVVIDPDSYGTKIGLGGRYSFAGNGNFTIGLGNLVQGTAAKGINFTANTPAEGMTSQLLNWYEEGTFTPTIRGSSTVGTATYSTQVGSYTRIGRLVYVQIALTWSAHTGTGNLRIGALPFTAGISSLGYGWLTGYNHNLTLSANNYLMGAEVVSGNNYATFYQSPTGGGSAASVPIDTAASIEFSGTYVI